MTRLSPSPPHPFCQKPLPFPPPLLSRSRESSKNILRFFCHEIIFKFSEVIFWPSKVSYKSCTKIPRKAIFVFWGYFCLARLHSSGNFLRNTNSQNIFHVTEIRIRKKIIPKLCLYVILWITNENVSWEFGEQTDSNKYVYIIEM